MSMSKELREIVDKKPEERTEDEGKTLQAHIVEYKGKVRELDLSYGLSHAAILAFNENGIVPTFKVVALPDDIVEVPKEGNA